MIIDVKDPSPAISPQGFEPLYTQPGIVIVGNPQTSTEGRAFQDNLPSLIFNQRGRHNERLMEILSARERDGLTQDDIWDILNEGILARVGKPQAIMGGNFLAPSVAGVLRDHLGIYQSPYAEKISPDGNLTLAVRELIREGIDPFRLLCRTDALTALYPAVSAEGRARALHMANEYWKRQEDVDGYLEAAAQLLAIPVDRESPSWRQGILDDEGFKAYFLGQMGFDVQGLLYASSMVGEPLLVYPDGMVEKRDLPDREILELLFSQKPDKPFLEWEVFEPRAFYDGLRIEFLNPGLIAVDLKGSRFPLNPSDYSGKQNIMYDHHLLYPFMPFRGFYAGEDLISQRLEPLGLPGQEQRPYPEAPFDAVVLSVHGEETLQHEILHWEQYLRPNADANPFELLRGDIANEFGARISAGQAPNSYMYSAFFYPSDGAWTRDLAIKTFSFYRQFEIMRQELVLAKEEGNHVDPDLEDLVYVDEWFEPGKIKSGRITARAERFDDRFREALLAGDEETEGQLKRIAQTAIAEFVPGSRSIGQLVFNNGFDRYLQILHPGMCERKEIWRSYNEQLIRDEEDLEERFRLAISMGFFDHTLAEARRDYSLFRAFVSGRNSGELRSLGIRDGFERDCAMGAWKATWPLQDYLNRKTYGPYAEKMYFEEIEAGRAMPDLGGLILKDYFDPAREADTLQYLHGLSDAEIYGLDRQYAFYRNKHYSESELTNNPELWERVHSLLNTSYWDHFYRYISQSESTAFLSELYRHLF